MLKTTLTAAALAIALLSTQTNAPAEAGNLSIGFYYGGPVYGPIYPAPVYRARPYHRRAYGPPRLTCRDARRQIRYHGFRRIRSIDCHGKIYRFWARKYGHTYLVKVNAYNGSVWI